MRRALLYLAQGHSSQTLCQECHLGWLAGTLLILSALGRSVGRHDTRALLLLPLVVTPDERMRLLDKGHWQQVY